MNITFVMSLFNRKHLVESGGGIKSLFVIASQLVSRGHQVSIISIDKKNREYVINVAGKGIRVYEYKRSIFFLIFPHLMILRMYRIMKKFEKNTDIFHFYNVQADIFGHFYKILGGRKKVVSTLNNYVNICPNYTCLYRDKICKDCNFFRRMTCLSDLIKNNIHRSIERIVFYPLIPPFSFLFPFLFTRQGRGLDKYIAISNSVKELYQARGYKDITVIPNPLDNSFKCPKKERERIIIYVGRVKKSKGIENLIQAFLASKILRKKRYILKIIGEGNFLNSLKNKYGREESIYFTGNINYHKLPEEYAKAELFVHPGLWPEPFGRTILESISCGCKILVSNLGEPPNIVGKKDFIYQFNNINELRSKMEMIVEDDSGGFVDKKILENYNTSRIVGYIENIYKQLVNYS